MGTLNQEDFRAALNFLALIGGASDLEDFGQRLTTGMHNLIACHSASYNEVNTRRRRVRWITNLKTTSRDIEAFEIHIPENPLLNHMKYNWEAGAVTISDLVSDRAWKGSGVYRDLYHPLGCEKIIAVSPSATPMMIGIALFRDRTDFKERDRAILTLLRPHLAHAYRNAAMKGDLGGRLALLERGLDHEGLGAIILSEHDTVSNITDKARAALRFFYGYESGALPDELKSWLWRTKIPASTAGVLPDVVPLTITRGGARLTFRQVHHGRYRLILLRVQGPPPAPEDLRRLGLTRRESEMLALVAAGETDAKIATTLSLSPRTVNHTLERVYRKLGVKNRAAAVARAFNC